MDDYIKRSDAISCIGREYRRSKTAKFGESRGNRLDVIKNILRDVNAIPASDVRENVRGKWELVDKLPEPDGKWVRCSVCRSSEHLEYNHAKLTWKFCPNCGADMRGNEK